MLCTMQDDDELYGGARRIRMTPEATAAQEKADGFKKQIRENDNNFRDTYMEIGRENADMNVDKMFDIVRQEILIKACWMKVLALSTLMQSPRR